ncbi:MAG: 50S ribosomal protein L21 [Candidatus Omnitrophica bacterium]|jgi:large subunit ribosomal protein L21|nr:50S ribosomal protein L21 [Candidatus Omnitrophota bacterium]MDD5655477.1 50S ribosomal protein L21 [Candidatus Omnitrophota bacterium]
MYAIIEVGGRQYNVQKGDVLEVEKQEADKDSKNIVIEKVLLVAKDSSLDVGRPYVKGASVTAEILGQIRARKVMSFKYKRRKSTHWKKGHRQQMTRIQIKEIALS